MRSPWSKWSVFEYMKHRFVRTGRVPDQQELLMEFTGMELSEIDEGVKEFQLAIEIGGERLAQ
ncbi:hypothetical protein [Paenibacillus solani]|uniref:hypothetical protein n=1 Tax=Paenibacillus solani TaxID=1705565 RepID=UPI003D2E0962